MLLQQSPASIRNLFSRLHWPRGRSIPGSWMLGSLIKDLFGTPTIWFCHECVLGVMLPRSPNTIWCVLLDHCDGLQPAIKDELAALAAVTRGESSRWASGLRHETGGMRICNLTGMVEMLLNLALMRAIGNITAERMCECARTELEGLQFDGAQLGMVCAT